MKRLTTIILLLVVTTLHVCAQQGRLFGSESLPTSIVNCILQDKRGMLWVGTQDGLCRYDGYKFYTYKQNSPLMRGIQGNNVTALAQTDLNSIFIGTSLGVSRLTNTSQLDTIRLDIPGHERDGFFVRSLLPLANGNLLIATSGFGVLELKAGTLKAKIRADIPADFLMTNKMLMGINGWLWVSSDFCGLIRVKDNKVYRYFTDEQHRDAINDICQTPDGKVIVAAKDGLYIYNKVTNQFVLAEASQGIDFECLRKLNGSQLLAGTERKGIMHIEVNGLDCKLIPHPTYDKNFDLFQASIRYIEQDLSGGFWSAMPRRGLYFWPMIPYDFGYVGHQNTAHSPFGESTVTSVLASTLGDVIWVGTDQDGLFAIDPNNPRAAAKKHIKVGSSIMDIAETHDGQLFIATTLQGVCRVDKASGSLHQLELGKGVSDFVFALTDDRRGHLWIGTLGSGVVCHDLTSGRNIQFTERPDGLANSYVGNINLSADGRYIHVSTSNGISSYDLDRNQWVKGGNRLRGKSTNCIYDDGTWLWVSHTYGLIRLNAANKGDKGTEMLKGTPLERVTIRALWFDGRGRLWASSNKGLCVITNPTSRRPKIDIYHDYDGLFCTEYTDAFSQLNDGRIAIGGHDGINIFTPEKITYVNQPLNFWLVKAEMNGGGLPEFSGIKAGSETKEIHLAYDENNIRLNFSTFNFTQMANVEYRYRINDGEWQSLPAGQNTIAFNAIAPGSYLLTVVAHYGQQQSKPINLKFVISPVWYLSWWMKTVYLLAAAGLIFFYFKRQRERQQGILRMMESANEVELREQKLQFFLNMGHEIRTPMSLIVTPIQQLIEEDTNPSRHHKYMLVKRNAQRILGLVNQMMDIGKIDKGLMQMHMRRTDMTHFVEEICQTFAPMAQQKGIAMRLSVNGATRKPLPEVWAWVDRMNFDKVIVNLMSNAFKFAPEGGHVDIAIRTSQEFLFIDIADDGEKISNDKLELIFKRFYQVSSATNEKYAGSGIGLSLSRSLVELHHGSLKAKNNEGAGCTFTVTLPLGNAHLKPSEMIISSDEDNISTSVSPNVSPKISPNVSPEETIEDSTNENIPSPEGKDGKLILIAEDDDEIRNYLKEQLLKSYKVIACPDGKEAWERVLTTHPDLVVSDVMMPRMDGLELLQKMRRNINCNHIPVVLLTAKTTDEDRLNGLEVGADAYISKPFSLSILQATIQNLLEKSHLLANKYSGQENKAFEEIDNKPQLQSPDERLMDRIIKVMNKHVSDEDINTQLLADEVGISRVHLYRKLKELTNQSPSEFIRNIRLKQAARLLQQGGQSISEVAYACGFSNVASFSNSFKRFYGVSPSQYAEKG